MNARGELHCRMCDRYLPTDCFRLRSDTGKPYAYCIVCRREYHRTTYAMKGDTPGRLERQRAANRVRRIERRRDRMQFCQKAVEILKSRGFSCYRIGKMTNLHTATVLRIDRKERFTVRKATIEKLSNALITTAGRV